jgi:hypothetical protein
MEGNSKLSVGEWSDATIPMSAGQPLARRHASSRIIGVDGTLLLHTLALYCALPSTRANRSHSFDISSLGSTLEKSEPAPSDTLVLIELPISGKSDRDRPAETPAAGAAANQILVAVIRPEPSQMMDVEAMQIESQNDEASKAPLDSGNGAEFARLYGIYSGQIQARVERAWYRPRTPVNEGDRGLNAATKAEYFRCQARIIQDSGGNVQDVLLPRCNGSIAWQRSLVTAIRQSSPLPAPPNPKVFSPAVILEFTGYPYGAGVPDEGYERAPIRPMQTQSSINASSASAQD